jgi:signal transduction histidine kinase
MNSPEQDTASRNDESTIWKVTSRVAFMSLGVGVASFLVTEVMHFLLVPDIGRIRERLLAEGFSAIVVTLLTAGLMHAANQRRAFAMLRMQVIDEMNHHIRNALTAISLTADSMQNQQSIRVILDSVNHIDWTLREILPRAKPLQEDERQHLWFFPRRDPGPQNIKPGISGERTKASGAGRS